MECEWKNTEIRLENQKHFKIKRLFFSDKIFQRSDEIKQILRTEGFEEKKKRKNTGEWLKGTMESHFV